jgi:hypothetical protein
VATNIATNTTDLCSSGSSIPSLTFDAHPKYPLLKQQPLSMEICSPRNNTKRKIIPHGVDEMSNGKQQQSSQSPPTAMDHKQCSIAARRIWNANLAFLKSLGPCRGSYLDAEDLRRLNIACSDLDLRSGKSSGGGNVFMTPFPMEKLHAILDEKGPFTMNQLVDTPNNHNLYDAMEVANLISFCTSRSAKENDFGLMHEQTTWRLRGQVNSRNQESPGLHMAAD